MALGFSPSSTLHHCYLVQTKLQNNHTNLSATVKRRNAIFQKTEPSRNLKFEVRNNCFTQVKECSGSDFDWDEAEEVLIEGEDEDEGSPWEGAVVYARNPLVSHLEYCTTLERLGLRKLSTNISSSRASLMGIRVTKDVTDYPEGTPVLVSFDVTFKQRKIRLDGIIRTVITLGCYRCGEPAAGSIFSNFSLLLSEEPIEGAENLDMGSIFGSMEEEDIDGNDSSIDLEDQLYFPREKRTIDISKHIRDLVHLEITINAICDPQCKGLCLKCGINLNYDRCKCDLKPNVERKGFGPLGGLKSKMQQRR
ncbi:unnamed protein product [Cuscuta europaea]|uniref:Large ribosomal RNA subunit accumulation protein YCED homolog 1, chloroplastic n=1 Tax=Cuscuta europaea TaxID=41803 RepID=A0A9P0Z3B5_CUSEU|nr:unnamed protein product [Cuscuta europaea]